MKCKYKTKKYFFNSLLDKYTEVVKRCQLIEYISKSFDFIPNTKIQINDDFLIYKQLFLNRISYKNISGDKKKELLKKFSYNLDKLQNIDFVHGDIHGANIIYDGYQLNLIDLEPSFRQNRHGKKVFMSAAPTRSLNDIANKRISSETDKLGFYLFSFFFLNTEFYSKMKINKIISKRKNGFQFTPIKESEFVKLSFSEIYNYVSCQS